MNYYEQLGIAVDSDFTAVKKAYYRRAKECHPDLFRNAAEKAEEFKRLVMIFDTLSDPVKRRSYDETILVESRISYAAPCGADSIMDTGANDTLEELIVGNDPPEDNAPHDPVSGFGEDVRLHDLPRGEKSLCFKEIQTFGGAFHPACRHGSVEYSLPCLAGAFARADP